MTQADFVLPGTQPGTVSTSVIMDSSNCRACHGGINTNDPYSTWSGSLMGQAGRDPLFFAQMSLANQDVANVGTYCLRCHMPASQVSGHVTNPSGSSMTAYDKDGVSCHLCHSMVDPLQPVGQRTAADNAILAALGPLAPQAYGNAMFVIDPQGVRRGPRPEGSPLHTAVQSAFFRSGNMCGTCHDVGNVASVRQADGTYVYNALNTAPADVDPRHQFPLERTYTEWRLSAFNNGGVDMGGKFGGSGATVVSSCQDCHMPRGSGKNCIVGPDRADMARHDFAGAAAQVLDVIAAFTAGDPAVDQAAISRGRTKAVDMLRRAAVLSATQNGSSLVVRVTNESGHKLPTGHIEGRRVWVNARFFDTRGSLVGERGAYDGMTATLDEESTTVFGMHVGLDQYASGVTGIPPGPTAHMSLANTIVKDNRIPPRGFNNAAYAAEGAPAVGAVYADGQYWADVPYELPAAAARAELHVYYQNTPREYIEHLRDANHTDNSGQLLYNLWSTTGRGAPIEMASLAVDLTPVCAADIGGPGGFPGADGNLNNNDFIVFISWFFGSDPRRPRRNRRFPGSRRAVRQQRLHRLHQPVLCRVPVALAESFSRRE
ncbi:MAG: hypothetical protein QM783_12040 [Phycisphaerales bacterium]